MRRTQIFTKYLKNKNSENILLKMYVDLDNFGILDKCDRLVGALACSRPNKANELLQFP
jgi:hypothetical protein